METLRATEKNTPNGCSDIAGGEYSGASHAGLAGDKYLGLHGR